MKGVNAGRLAAARALLAVEDGVHVEDELARQAPRDGADRALAWHLALGVLRHRPGLDGRIAVAAKRAVRTLDPPVLAILRLAAFEQAQGRAAPYAVVDQAVELSRKLGVGHAAGFVNAVARKLATIPEDPALAHGHPTWIAARWRARHGAAAEAWMAANNQPAETFLLPREDPAGFARELQHQGVVVLPVGPCFRVSAPVESLPGYAEGRFWVMDPAAVAVADLVPEVPAVLDACAAPGGKSFRLASRGMAVCATDLLPARLARMEENQRRLGLFLEIAQHDWEAGPLDRQFPAVLLDAPCSGLGTLRRHPDIRWRRKESDLARYHVRQVTMLRHAAACVEPGGCIVYAVCSPEPEEGEAVAASLGWIEEARFANAPCVQGEDAFFAVRLRRP